jgi:transcriptional regulator with XRE-family HTH domain
MRKEITPEFDLNESEGFRARLRTALDEVPGGSGIERVAQRAGIARRTIHAYMAGETDPSRGRLLALAKATGVGLLWLVTGEGPMRPGSALGNPGPDMLVERDRLRQERDEADRQAGALLRENSALKESERRRSDWLCQAKRDAGADQGESFDAVWARALAALKATQK